jgi:hypothetical protein
VKPEDLKFAGVSIRRERDARDPWFPFWVVVERWPGLDGSWVWRWPATSARRAVKLARHLERGVRHPLAEAMIEPWFWEGSWQAVSLRFACRNLTCQHTDLRILPATPPRHPLRVVQKRPACPLCGRVLTYVRTDS